MELFYVKTKECEICEAVACFQYFQLLEYRRDPNYTFKKIHGYFWAETNKRNYQFMSNVICLDCGFKHVLTDYISTR